jgi:nucleotide-binding universal stress UspA family protein
MFKKILVCLDGSNFSEQILQYVLEETIRTDIKIILLRVIQVPHSIGKVPPGVISSVPPVPPSPEQLAEEETKVKEYLDGKAKSLKESGIKVECVAITGNPGEAIVNYANNNKVDLIAIATHGRTGIKRMIFGSVTEYVIKNSGAPILLIKPK